MNMESIIAQIDGEIARLTNIKGLLQGTPERRGPGRPRGTGAIPAAKKQAKRTLSPEARARISASTKARWARVKAAQQTQTNSKSKKQAPASKKTSSKATV